MIDSHSTTQSNLVLRVSDLGIRPRGQIDRAQCIALAVDGIHNLVRRVKGQSVEIPGIARKRSQDRGSTRNRINGKSFGIKRSPPVNAE